MAKISSKERLRREGAAWAIQKVKDLGLEEAEKEFTYRGITGTPMAIAKEELKAFQLEVKKSMAKMFSIVSCMVLRDEFEFGEKRIRKFIKRFNLKTACLDEEYATWEDYQDILQDELGIDVFKEE